MQVAVFVKLHSTGAFVDVVLVVMRMFMVVAMRVIMIMSVLVVMIMREVNIEFHSGDGRFLLARNVEVVAAEFELFQLTFKPARIHAQVQQRPNEHVAGDAADEVEIEVFHFCSSALICEAA